ncbi:MAG: zf-HC2 domain-containing protein [Vicinamibacterales bacterium]
MTAHPSGDDLGRHLRVLEALGRADEHLAYDDIEAFVDGGLDDIGREAVEAHAAACAACAAELDDLAAFRASLPTKNAPEAARVVPMPVRPRRIPRVAPWLAAAAVLVLAVAVARRTDPPLTAPNTPAPAPVDRPAAAQSAAPAIPAPAAPAVEVGTPLPAPEPATALRLRGGERRVGGKTFRFESGVWVDEAYDSLALLPEESLSGPSRAALIGREPALAAYSALGSRVVVVHAGTVYRLEP